MKKRTKTNRILSESCLKSAMLAGLAFTFLSPAWGAGAVDATREANTIILDEIAVQNLRIQTEMVELRNFETTVFSVGRIEQIPSKLYSVSSRISGRAIEVKAFEGDQVTKGDVLVMVESRQPGNPPPTIALKAIADGIIVESHVLVGQPVDPETDLLDVVDRTMMWAVAKIPEREASRVRPGTKARIFIPAMGGEPILATLSRYGVSADRESGSVEGVFEIPNPEGKLVPGMRAEFSLITSSRSRILSAPKSAIQGDPTKRVLYVKDVELPNAFTRTPVVLGEQNDRYVEVISGLYLGADVVTQGSYSLGFAGSGSGVSLREALDIAHGHKHNDDGSEMTDAQRKAAEKAKAEQSAGETGSSGGPMNPWLLGYSILITLVALVLFQQVLNKRNRQKEA